MPSSPIPAARRQPLLDLLSQVPDQRKERGRRHPLAGLLAVGIAAVTAGARSFAAISQWAADAGPGTLAALGATRGAADESTCRRTFAQASADALDAALGAWLRTRTARAGGRMVIAVDGKAVRGAKGRDGKAPHLVAALAHGIGAVPGQAAADAKPNEIPAVRELLRALAGLTGAVLAMDALHAQHDTAQAVLARHAGYVMTVKANVPTLHSQLKKLPWKDVPAFSRVTKDHGRRARRTVKALLAPAWTGFEGAAQVAQVRRTVTREGKKAVEVVYVITSDAIAAAVPMAMSRWDLPVLRRLSRRLGGNRAKRAVTRSILVIIWHLLSDPSARFRDPGPGWHDRTSDRDRKIPPPTSASSGPRTRRHYHHGLNPRPLTRPVPPTPQTGKPCPRMVADSHGHLTQASRN